MLNKYSTLVVGAMLGLGTLAFSGAGASAAAMLPLAPVVSGEASGLNEGIVQVNHKKKWHKKNSNNWCDYNGGCKHKHRKHRRHRDFDRSDLFLPLIIGGFGAYNYYDYDDGYNDDYGFAGFGSEHVRWCLNRYRSYNPRTNLWRAYSGKKYQCNSPYY